MTNLGQVTDEEVERLLDECFSPYELGWEAANIALLHLAKFGFLVGAGTNFRDNIGRWVEEYIGDRGTQRLDLGPAIVTLSNHSVSVRLYDNAKEKIGAIRVCLPASCCH